MESSRSLYSKLQSIEKDEALKGINSPIRSNSTDHQVIVQQAPASIMIPEPVKVSKPLGEINIKQEPLENIQGNYTRRQKSYHYYSKGQLLY